jgi:transposase
MKHIHPAKEFKRNLAIRLFKQGESTEKIADLTGYSISWVKQLYRTYQRLGSDGLVLQKPGGSVCRLTDDNFITLRSILDKGSIAYGLEGDFWDRKRVKYVIKETFNIEYDVKHISDILAKMGYTLQKPRKKDFRQDDAQVAKWTEDTLPEIKKK